MITITFDEEIFFFLNSNIYHALITRYYEINEIDFITDCRRVIRLMHAFEVTNLELAGTFVSALC